MSAQRVITKYSDIPEEMIIDLLMYRGNIQPEKVKRPADPDKLPKSIFLLKEGRKGNKDYDYERVTIDISKGIDSSLPAIIEDPLSIKKTEILKLNIPDFVYLNQSTIDGLYNAYNANPVATHRPIVEKIVSEHVKEGSISAGVDIKKLLEVAFQEKELIKYIQSIKYVEKTTEEKFPSLIKELLLGENLVLDLEFENKKSKELEKFDSLITNLSSNFGLEVHNSKIESVRSTLGRQTIEDSLDELRKADNKFAIVRAKFKIEHVQEVNDDKSYFTFSFVNPIKGQVDQSVEIQFYVKEKEIRESWLDIYSREKRVDPNVFGIVYHSDWKEDDSNTWQIKINPYAVYY